MYIDSSEQSMGLLRAIDGPAPSNKPSRSEREAVSLPARSRLAIFPWAGNFFFWAGRKFLLGQNDDTDDDDTDDSGGVYFLTVWLICISIIIYNVHIIYIMEIFFNCR